VAPGRVRDLHVADPVAVQLDDLVEVVAVHRQVVQVAEEADAGGAGLPLHPVDDADDVRGGLEGIARRAADRFHQGHATHPLRRRRGQGELPDGQVVLLLRRRVVEPVAVQRVEAPAPQLLADADGHLDVVAEFGRPRRPGHQPAVAGWHVPSEEVQAHQADAGVSHRPHERVGVAVGRHGDAERPPELDRVEARGLGRARAFEQREFGEEDGQVDIEVGHANPSL
jgi:hypothetical protein